MDSFKPDQGAEQTTDQLTFKVGEREFNADSAATKISAADAHIATVETENQSYKDRIASLEAQVAQGTKIEDALSQLQAGTQESQTTPDTNGVSEEQIGAIANRQIEGFLAERQAQQVQADAKALAETTFQNTGAELVKMYGDDVDKAVEAKATELGIAKKDMYAMATSPSQSKMLLEFMKVGTPSDQSAPSGDFNTHGFNNAPVEHFVDRSKPITSSTVMEALQKAGATY